MTATDIAEKKKAISSNLWSPTLKHEQTFKDHQTHKESNMKATGAGGAT